MNRSPEWQSYLENVKVCYKCKKLNPLKNKVCRGKYCKYPRFKSPRLNIRKK